MVAIFDVDHEFCKVWFRIDLKPRLGNWTELGLLTSGSRHDCERMLAGRENPRIPRIGHDAMRPNGRTNPQ